MEKEYISSYNRNYLKIKPQGELQGKLRYQYQILTGKKLDGILGADFHIHNGESGLYYDITGKVNLPTLFSKKKINLDFMNRFISSLETALWSLEQYLLDERNLMLQPEYLYVDMDNMQNQSSPEGSLYFVYCPYFTETEERDVEPLFTFLLEKAEEEDAELMDAIFNLYAAWENLGEQFRGESLLHAWPMETSSGTEEAGVRDATGIKGDKGNKDREKLSGENTYAMVREENMHYEEKADRRTYGNGAEKEDRMLYGNDEEKEERKLYGNGRQNRRVLTLTRFPVIIGRKPEYADLVINEPSVDSMHVKILEEDGHIYMEDMNAAAGTFKNGIQLRPYERVELLREDEVKFGKLEFTYR